ncbi:quinone-dependent dihydroorotate dehydrogenase [Neomegalonema sp.]|uniref:quinone-dependent dihydroorotate dehydrogenase n=1 Tax=Neomegalonema sp. TaxID=2039713 RepID=UPI00262BAD75|nr:quinone-dependent dihydroorotate dehydrogenase [Neomegalonema sp.]MDD2870310.1 quinone-dependent dihydroorotate dehydrogenase [Neomegalonema sp.]
MFASALRLLPPETAHRLALWGLARGLGPRISPPEDPGLRVELWGRSFSHPIGLAAGFDKNAVAVPGLFALGFGFVEVGAVTPRPQPGNPQPRLFRLTPDRAIVNRMGFNNAGLEAARAELSGLPEHPGPVGVNLGANKDSEDRAADYEAGIRAFAPLADFLTINVSSPNTERLRDLQGAAALDALLGRCLDLRDSLKAEGKGAAPILLKIAPDLGASELADVAEICLARRIDGIVATNTTLSLRDRLKDSQRDEKGGLSGAPLFELSTQVLRDLRRLTRGEIPLIGVGGVSTPEQAWTKIRAGASLVQIYSAMIYEGPGLAVRIARGLPALMKRDGFRSVSEAVGTEKP